MRAGSLSNFRDKEFSKGWDLTMTFYDSTGKASGVLEADSGYIKQKTNYIELFGSIQFTTPEEEGSAEPMTLWCSKLVWDPGKEKVWSDTPVRVKRPGEEIRAQGFESDLNFKHIKFVGEVRGEGSK